LVAHTAKQTRELQKEVHILEGLLPICSFCKKIRNTSDTWEAIEKYISEHSEAQFSHSLCPDCAVEQYPDYFKARGG
jgi:hypothetical protein